MTEEKDGPVHYQVSVTGRQAAAFFLVLLAALGLSFFFGMRTGAAAKRGPDSVSALAAQSDIAVPPAPAEGDRAEKGTPVPTEPPIGFEATAPEPKPAAVEATRAPLKVEERAAPKEEKVALPKEAPKPPTKVAEPTAKPAEKATPVPAKEKAAVADEGPFWVQILVTKNAEKADAFAKKLKADGFHPDVSLVPDKKDLFRVRIGSYPDRARAEAAALKVEKAEKLQAKPIVVSGK